MLLVILHIARRYFTCTLWHRKIKYAIGKCRGIALGKEQQQQKKTTKLNHPVTAFCAMETDCQFKYRLF